MVIRNAGRSKMSLLTYFDSLMGSAFVKPSRSAELSRNCVVPVHFIPSESFHNSFTGMVHIPWCLKQIYISNAKLL